MSLYVGVNGTPKKLKKLFVGVNGSAKEVKTGYVGGSGVKKVYSASIEDQLAEVNPVAALTSGKITSAHIGRTVYLSNSATACQEWVIADVNHDGTSGTVDLFSKTLLHGPNDDGVRFSYYGSETNIYSGSRLDDYVESTIYNGFTTEVKNALNNMNVASNGETIQRHVVVPSLSEFGSGIINEGTVYSMYNAYSESRGGTPVCIPFADGGYYNNAHYWTRSKYNGGVAFARFNDRFSDGDKFYLSISTVARIRFAKA